MTEPFDPLPWLQHELKVREFYDKRLLEAERISIEFSKLIITNLVWINATGLGTLPVVSSFIGIGSLPWSQKFPLLIGPGASFALGLLTALLCALIVYFNFGCIVRTANHECVAEINILRMTQPVYTQSPELKAVIDREREAGLFNAQRMRRATVHTLWLSHILGWLSFASFAVACYQLVRIVVP